jgi:hypothetical protein
MKSESEFSEFDSEAKMMFFGFTQKIGSARALVCEGRYFFSDVVRC